jgi:peptide methionine sulfoxide reductase msrA/msrB
MCGLAFSLLLACSCAGAEDKMPELKKAYFAGGCFWCMEGPFEKVEGVTGVDSGYANSKTPNPSYDEVSGGTTGAYEAVEVIYDASKVTFEDLLNVYWTTIDPTQKDGQFADRGSQYLTAVFYQNDEEKVIAEESKKILDESGIFKKPIVVEVLPFKNWTRAEEYHQDYHKKNATHYTMYSMGSGRKGFLDRTWNKKPYCPLRKVSPEKIKAVTSKK